MPLFFNPKYTAWKSAEDMHADVKLWLSELEFILTEQHFLDNLFGDYFIKLSSPEFFNRGKDLVERLEMSVKGVNLMIQTVKKHNNDLEVLLDGQNQPFEEREVKAEHTELEERVFSVLHAFKELKADFFITIGDILVQEKRKRLLN